MRKFLSFVLFLMTFSISYSQNLGVKLADGVSPNTTFDVNGAVSFREGTALTLTNGVNSNVALSEYSFMRVTGPTAAFSITGFSGGNDGRVLTIMNNTSQVMTLTHQATSLSANQINTGGTNTVIAANGLATLYYSSNLSKWVVTAVTGATPTFTTINTGNYTDSMIVINNGVPGRVPPREYIETYAWGLDGNAGTTAGTHFLGTTDAQDMVVKTNNTERMRVSSAGYVGINNSTPTYRLHIEDPSGSDADILSRVYNNGVVTGIPGLLLQTASGTKAAPIRMPSGGQLGVIRWGGYDGSAFNDTWCAEIAAMATQNWTTTAHGTGMWFRTIQNDSTLSRARMVITHNGFVGLGFDSYTPQYKLDIDAQSGGTGNPLRLLGLNAGATSDSIISSNSGILRRLSINQIIASAWNISGNSGTVDGTNFIGTTDNIPLSIRVNNQKAGRIDHLLANSFWGYQAGNAITTGSYNTAIGQSALAALTQGTANLGVGTSALAALTTGSDNTALGSSTLATMTTGNSNVAIGNQSGLSNTTGVRNVSIGYQSARNGTHSNSIMIGYQAGLQNAASNNVFIGSLSGPLTSTGSDNIGMGYYTLFNNTTGKNNIGIGSFALSTAFTAWGNTSIGHMSSASIQSGQANTAVGDSSLMNNVLGSNNTHIGYRAGLWTTGSNNIAIGYNATLPVTTADNQLALGTWLYGTNSNLGINTTTPQYKLDIDAKTGSAGNPLRLLGLSAGATTDSLLTSSSGIVRRVAFSQYLGSSGWSITGNAGTVDGTNFLGTTDNIPLSIRVNNQKAGRIDHLNSNAFYGYLSGNANTGTYNSFFGHQAGTLNTSGNYNTGLGYGAMGANTTASNNVSIGAGSMESNTTGYDNVAIGRHSMRKNTTFYNNTAVGTYSLQENVGGYYNTAMGWSALNQNTSGYNNVGIGAQALLANTTGNSNVGIGMQSLYFNTVGSNNTSVGIYSMFNNISGNNNTAFGTNTLSYNSTAWGNTAFGYQAAFANTTGQGLVAIGDSALYNSLTASGNTGLGYRAGTVITTGSNNTFIGYLSNAASNALTNATAIGANAVVGASNSLILGGTGANDVNVGIGTTAPSRRLTVSRNATTDDNDDDIYIQSFGTYKNPAIIMQAAGGTESSPTNLAAGDTLGGTYFKGYIGGSSQSLAAMTSLYLGNGTTSKSIIAFNVNGSGTVNEKMRIDSSGNIGIGILTPSVKLHQDNGTATANYHKFTAGTTTGQTTSDGFDVGVDASGNAILDQNEAKDVIINTNSAEVVRVTSAGNVLVGALTPGETTAIALVNESSSDQKDDVTITTYNTTTTPAFVLFKARGTAAAPSTLTNSENLGGFNVNGYAGTSFRGLTSVATITASDFTTSYGADIAFKTSRSGVSSERMRILSTGNVGIGCTAPQYTLHVVGTLGVSTSIRSPSTTSGAITACSDSRYKTNITPLSNALENILKMQGVRYDWRVNEFPEWSFSKRRQIGFIAQDLEKIYPELVETDEKGYKSVDYSKVTAILVEAVKEVKKENDDLKAEVQKLKAELNQKDKTTEGVLLRLEKLEAAIAKTQPIEEKQTSTRSEKEKK
ncbi:MAG: tail fiber domain-containing protein [Saprospiraceae bacterium]|nr:tail fiber domain-containing protein [Saprospiraceae bacterium]